MARFSEAFLILRAREQGLPDALAPAVFILMNLVYALSAYPAGWLADRVDRRALLAGGLLVLIAADLALARAGGWAGVAAGVALWGLHLGLTQGLFAAMVAAAAPAGLRGTAFGFFNLAGGGAMLAASLLAGALSRPSRSRSCCSATAPKPSRRGDTPRAQGPRHLDDGGCARAQFMREVC